MEIIKSKNTEEIGVVLSKEEAEALGYALSRFSCHDADVLSNMVNTYLSVIDINYSNASFNAMYKRYILIDNSILGKKEVEVFSIRVP